MVAPVIAAGVMAVARYIAKQGITKAIKKYGQKSVTEAKKHVKDVTTKPTAGQKQIRTPVAAQRASRRAKRIGFGVGVGVAGAGATVKVKDLKEKLKNAKTAELRAKYKAQIEAEMRKLAAAKKQPKPIRPKPKPKTPIETSLRPKKRPTT